MGSVSLNRVRAGVLAFVLAAAGTGGGVAFVGGVAGAPDAAAQDKGKPKKGEPSDAEKAFAADYGSEDAAKRAKAVEGLSGAPEAVRFDLIATRVVPKEKRADVISRAIEVLGRIRDESVCEKVATLARSGATDQRLVYLEALAYMPQSGAAHRTLLGAAKDPQTWVRAMACFGLGEHRTADAIETLLAALDDRQWQVQSAALAALPRIQDKDALRAKAVPKLVEMLDLLGGRQRADCADALKRITGKNLGKDPDVWRRWIAGGDDAVKKPGDAAEPKAPEGGDSPYANQPAADKPHFYGIEVNSTRVVIVLDTSLSMNDPIEIDKDRLRRETSRRRVVTGGDAPKPGEDVNPDDVGYDIPWWRIKSRLDLARYQAIHVVSQLTPEQSFELILFNTKVEPWMNRLVPATQANKQKAVQLLENLKPDGETNTWGALSAAFEMSAASVRTGGGGSPDEIYFVTDGAPSKGDITDGEQIYEATMQLAKVHQMRINVIGVGVNLLFLRKMAVSTGGQAKFFN